MMTKIETDLSDGTRARIWVHLDVIVVEAHDTFTIATRQRTDRKTLAEIAAVLTEASSS